MPRGEDMNAICRIAARKNGDAIPLESVSTTSTNENGHGQLGSPARGGERS
jgi:hypothetical protein